MSIEGSKENINFARNLRKMRNGRHATNEVMKEEMKGGKRREEMKEKNEGRE